MTRSNFTIEATDDGSLIQIHLWHEGRYLGQINALDNGPGLEIRSAVPAIVESDPKQSWMQFTTTVRIPEKEEKDAST